ncbi:hypothetical protein O181_017457 [Austropuccinia psidii MF-1]|uniref:Uncharacterized protein n=1 Tax=Austropuccinia psidii MF-1 TaxID=1389203 RepID=A0A9Q3C5X6_9BASI|nr:hypothetical protein [Austropuccinia psidii MF-1]
MDILPQSPNEIYCKTTKNPYRCPRNRCGIGAENKPLNSSFYMTGCYRRDPPFTSYAYLWPTFLYHSAPGRLVVKGPISSTLTGAKTNLGIYLNCTINGNVKPPINIMRPGK